MGTGWRIPLHPVALAAPTAVGASRLSLARREVLDVQVLGADERDFPFAGGHRFHDPETGAELELDAPAARAAFLERFAQARAARTRKLAAAGVRCVEHFLDEPADAPLRRLFAANGAAAARTAGAP